MTTYANRTTPRLVCLAQRLLQEEGILPTDLELELLARGIAPDSIPMNPSTEAYSQ